MKIKICGLFRDEDIEYVNEARPDYAGFVFAQSPRRVSPVQASGLRGKLADGIVPVGVFVNAPEEFIADLYRDGVIDIAQLHGAEDEKYIRRLKEAASGGGVLPIPVIKVFRNVELSGKEKEAPLTTGADYCLVDSGAGGGKTFDWDFLYRQKFNKPWFLAGGINIENIAKAMTFNPFAIDLSSGAEADGVKDRKKILRLTAIVHGNQ